MTDKPKPIASGLEQTIAHPSQEQLTRADDTLPVRDESRAARASIPPLPTHRYRHGKEIGRGGMGRVVEAYDTQLGRTVALKEVLPPSEAIERRFVREIEITARLEHHGIVPLYDSGTTPDGRPFYVMRRVSGKPLDHVIHAARQLDERLTLLPTMLAAIDAIAHAHKRGVIHRDLKPTNILVGEDGATTVIDWGLAKVIDEVDETDPFAPLAQGGDGLQTMAGAVFGTPGFMAPEQARGEALSPSSDVYALGATLYQLLAGKPPMSGTSVTEVLGKTLKNDVKPLAEVVSGVPLELIAIVDKALGFAAEARYRNAGELADDVRRFLDGRLVAAHDYTRRQRFQRFVKKHRAILGVIALALVAVAAFAWFSVSRVLAERDAADTARRQALQEKRVAEQARDRLAERNDELIVAQARGMLESNPTYSLATLADLSPSSKRMADARAVATAAVARGVWWAFEGPDDMTTRVEMTPDGSHLAQLTRDQVLHVWDLDRRKRIIARPMNHPSASVRWLQDGRLLVFSTKDAPSILDPAANQETPLGGTPLAAAAVSETGDRAVVIDTAGETSLLELSTGARTPVWPGHAAKDVVLAHDGSWFAVTDENSLAAFDRDGTLLTTRTNFQTIRIEMSRTRRLAALAYGRMIELVLDPKPVWTEIPFGGVGRNRIIVEMVYRDSALEMLFFGGELYGWADNTLLPRGIAYDVITGGMRVGANNALLVPANAGRIGLVTGVMKTSLYTPYAVPHARMIALPTTSRVVVVGDGIVMVTDLSAVVPRKLPIPVGTNFAFVDENLIVTWKNLVELTWARLDGKPATQIATNDTVVNVPIAIEPESGRVLYREEGGTGRRVYLVQREQREVTPVVDGERAWAKLVRPDVVIYGTGDGRVLTRSASGEEREVVKLDGGIDRAVSIAPYEYAAISAHGELVRGNVQTNALTRAKVVPGTSMVLISDEAKRVVIAVDATLYVWGTDLVQVATFDKAIEQIDYVPGAGRGEVIVQLADRSALRVALTANAQPVRILPPSQYQAVISADGSTIVALTGGTQLTVIDIASNARYTLPVSQSARASVAVSPTARTIIQDTFAGLMMWTLPRPDDNLGAWIADQTAARVTNDVLTWPWQCQ